MNIQKKIIGIMLLAFGIYSAPLLPFPALAVFPLIALLLNMPILALVFAILVDAFLVPSGAPFYVALTPYTILCIPISAYVRYNVHL